MPPVGRALHQSPILSEDAPSLFLAKPTVGVVSFQLYSGGELLGGLDIMKEMVQAGELAAALRPQA